MSVKTVFYLIILILIIFISGCMQPSNLKFTYEKCDNSFKFPKYNQGILKKEWINDTTILIEGYITDDCMGYEIKGDYKIDEDNLILYYKVKRGEVTTDCFCYRKLIYEISNMKKKEYNIYFK